MFGKVFFPDASPLVGTLLSFSSFWAGFIARPIGGLVFGHFGDKIGRKPALVICLMMMGLSTFAIGLLPTASTIGVAAPILLVLLRFAQGIAIGGQWGGMALQVPVVSLVSEFPMTATGKIRKVELAALAQDVTKELHR